MKRNVARSRLAITNPDKVFYPAGGFRKVDVVDYYARVAAFLLPHFRDRPVTLKRYPDGFTEWTTYGMLRHATFEGLRDDKEPREIVREAS